MNWIERAHQEKQLFLSFCFSLLILRPWKSFFISSSFAVDSVFWIHLKYIRFFCDTYIECSYFCACVTSKYKETKLLLMIYLPLLFSPSLFLNLLIPLYQLLWMFETPCQWQKFRTYLVFFLSGLTPAYFHFCCKFPLYPCSSSSSSIPIGSTVRKISISLMDKMNIESKRPSHE